jgi:quercetin dioxygenase-like cupin family protein
MGPEKTNSRVVKSQDFTWEGVERKEYKTETTNFRDISRFSLLGEGQEDHELNMQTRYFEILPGGYSSLEYHRHPHSVVIIRGSGNVVLNNTVTPISAFDVVYISPETVHQFHANQGEHLGFICVVDRYRDKPAIPSLEVIDRLVGTSGPARDQIRL